MIQSHYLLIMEKLTPKQQAELVKMSTDRMSPRLADTGYDPTQMAVKDWDELLDLYAEYISPRPVKG